MAKQSPAHGYKTGYGKPPVDTRFKKGESGNPAGRKKGAKSFPSMFRQVMNEKVVIRTASGKSKTISKFQAAVTQVINKAAAGNLQAFKMALAIMQHVDAEAGDATDALLAGIDTKALLKDFLARPVVAAESALEPRASRGGPREKRRG
jgi:hypothetical protein